MVKIDSAEWGKFTINGRTYFSDMYVFWDGKAEMRKKSHLFDMDEFLGLLRKRPKIIIIGTGFNGVVKVPEEVLQMAEDRNVELFMETTPKAVEVFNAFAGDGKRVIAVLHSTC